VRGVSWRVERGVISELVVRSGVFRNGRVIGLSFSLGVE
jgi:hypothetical protein